ncbi:MAG: hypothetical protein CMI02_10890 [Oceanospirillaceae bacterium]|nr:hypothetical protein [Oceanospirillaceae bacterium]
MSYEILSLGEVCEFSRGLTYKKSDEVECSANAVLRANNITLETGEINFDEVKYISDEIEIPASKKVKKDTLLICTASGSKKHLGKVGYIADDIDYAFGGFMGLLTPSEVIYPKYLYWLTQSKCYSDFIMGLTDGANINNLKFSQLKEFPVPVPAFREQKRIVSILDQAFADIDKARTLTEQNLKNVRELFESYLQQVFSQRGEGWEKVTLMELLERRWITSHLDGNHGGDYPRKSEFIDSGVPYISANCLVNGEIDFSKAKYLSDERAGKLRKGIAKNNDVIFAHNATVGPVAILKTNESQVILGTSLTYYRCDPDYILPEYLAQYMKTGVFTSQYKKVMRQSTRNQVPITKQREFFHLIPPIEQQKEFASFLVELSGKTEDLKEIYNAKIKALDELKKSFLQKAFSGELTKSSAEAAA